MSYADGFYDFLTQDRIQKIQQIIGQYGEENFYMSFSGGKDSTVLSELIDMALPENQIPRVYADTGIELRMIRDFVFHKKESDSRFHVIAPTVPIKPMLESEGYPFKSKKHAMMVKQYQKYNTTDGQIRVQHYLHISDDGIEWSSQNSCPNILRYQFTEECKLKISDRCCLRMKEDPLNKWMKEHNKKYGITGIMRAEGGRRDNAQCLFIRKGKLVNFQPLAPISKEWEEWFINEYNIEICDIYKPPYNFVRTGCKGCPFARDLQHELDILEKYFPNERKQCEVLWKPVYDEYRRLRYRLKPLPDSVMDSEIEGQMNIFDYLQI